MKRKKFIAALVVSLWMSVFGVASADISQTTFNGSISLRNSTSQNHMTVFLGTGLTQVVQSLSWYINTLGSGTSGGWNSYIIECNSGSNTIWNGGCSTGGEIDRGAFGYIATSTGGVFRVVTTVMPQWTMNPSKVYFATLVESANINAFIVAGDTAATSSYPTYCDQGGVPFGYWCQPYASSTGFTPFFVVSSLKTSGNVFDTTATSSSFVAVKCDFNNISGCMINALGWAFVPSNEVIDKFSNLSLASTTPFGYVYGIKNLWETDSATTSAAAVLSADLSPFLASTTGSSSIIVPIVSANQIHTTLGNNVWDMIQLLLTYCMWIGFMWYVWYRAHKLI